MQTFIDFLLTVGAVAATLLTAAMLAGGVLLALFEYLPDRRAAGRR